MTTTTLRSVHGLYLCAEADLSVSATRAKANVWEQWEVEPHANNMIALKSVHGRYLCAEQGGLVTANRLAVGPWELFEPRLLGDGTGALVSWQGTYLTAEPDTGRVIADRAHLGPWETWTSSLFAEPVTPSVPVPPRTGTVTLMGRCMVDADGPFCALGATYFPLVWMVRHDKARAEKNLSWLAQRGVQFVRALAEVGGATWQDRVIDPRSPDWPNQLREAMMTARACGLRVEWTLFGGGVLSREADWSQACDVWIDAVRPYVSSVQFAEVQNEGQGPNTAQARALASRVRTMLSVPVAITGTPEAGLGAIYKDSRATLMTLHCDRAYRERGWRPIRQIKTEVEWAGPWVNNEPIGIDSSVASESDPVKLAAGAITTWLVGACAHVLHTGAGIRAGGAADIERGRKADVWEQPALEPTLALIADAKTRLPADLPNWSRKTHGWADHPLRFATEVGDAVEANASVHGCNRAYAAVAGDGRWVCFIAGIQHAVEFSVGTPMTLWSLSTGRVVKVGAGAYELTESEWGPCVLLASE